MNQMMEGKPMGGRCGCGHHKIVPVLVVLFGLLFLLGNLGSIPMTTVNIIWPVMVMVVGLFKMMSSKCKCCVGGMMK